MEALSMRVNARIENLCALTAKTKIHNELETKLLYEEDSLCWKKKKKKINTMRRISKRGRRRKRETIVKQ